jgi:hypothetical protein
MPSALRCDGEPSLVLVDPKGKVLRPVILFFSGELTGRSRRTNVPAPGANPANPDKSPEHSGPHSAANGAGNTFARAALNASPSLS